MDRQRFVQVVALVVVTVFAAGIWLTGGTVDLQQWSRFFSLAIFVAVSLLTLWEHWLWCLPCIQNQELCKVTRDIRGTWQGTLQSFWLNPATGTPPAPKTVYLVIRQSASEISVVLLTNESRSKSSLARVHDDGVTASLDYMYLNWPDGCLEQRSKMHYGSTSLNIIGKPVMRLRGSYWTNRDTRGELAFNKRILKLSDDFAQAETMLSSNGIHRR